MMARLRKTICGTDVMPRFIDLGYDLFLDKETLKSRSLAADAVDPQSALNQWDGEIDIISLNGAIKLRQLSA